MRQLVPRLRQLAVGLAVGAILALAIPASQAQPADTLDWKRYYPLEVGNVWEYHGAEIRYSQTRHTLVADTVSNGQTYYRRQIDHALVGYFDMVLDTMRTTVFDYVRYDEGGVIGVPSVEADTVAFDPCGADGFERDLRPAFETTSPCPLPLLSPEADSVHVAGEYTTMWAPSTIDGPSSFDPIEVSAVKLYTVGLTIFSSFVADVGPTGTGNLWGPRLHYARVGGVEYGAASVLLDADSGAPAPPQIQIRVLHNPVRDWARFAIDTPPVRSARWTLTDALGRIVQTSDLDVSHAEVTVPTDELAPGVYRFVLRSGEAASSASFTVVR